MACPSESPPFWPARRLSRQRKVLADKPAFVSGSHMVKERSDPQSCPLTPHRGHCTSVSSVTSIIYLPLYIYLLITKC